MRCDRRGGDIQWDLGYPAFGDPSILNDSVVDPERPSGSSSLSASNPETG